MTTFVLDPRLEQDCHFMTETSTSLLLLMDNALYQWYVLVPKVNATELHEVDESTQKLIFSELMKLSSFIKLTFNVDKINIGAIGNIVKQLHIHVVGRCHNDATWPNVVWGADPKKTYQEAHLTNLRQRVSTIFE